MEDAEFLAEARQQNIEIGMMSGDAVQQIVDDLVNASPVLLDQVKQAIQVKGAVQLERKGAGSE